MTNQIVDACINSSKYQNFEIQNECHNFRRGNFPANTRFKI
jgi:hypothetical protein